MTTALVMSGGGSLGAVHVGMLKALIEHGVVPDLIVGTSVGAVNGAYISSRWSADGVAGLDAVWSSMTRASVFPTRFLGGFLGFIGRRNYLVPSSGLRRLVSQHAEFQQLENASIPLHVVATDLLSGIDRRFSAGPTVDAVLASAAIPAIFPPVIIEGKPFIDGGVVNNTPISHAIDLGATEVWVLPAGTSCGLDAAPTSPLAMALHSVSLLVHRRLQRDIGEFQEDCTLHLLPPLCPVSVSPTDFDQGRELIDRAYASSVEWLGSDHAGCDLSAVLAHPHG